MHVVTNQGSCQVFLQSFLVFWGGLEGKRGGESLLGASSKGRLSWGGAKPTPWGTQMAERKFQLYFVSSHFCERHILKVADSQSHRALGFPGCLNIGP